MNLRSSWLVIMLVGFLAACSGSDPTATKPGDNNSCRTTSNGNIAPRADAGPMQSVTTGDVVTLDGSQSSDQDCDELSYSWSVLSQPENSDVTLSDPSVVNPTFIPEFDGQYNISLIVNDGKMDSGIRVVGITTSSENAAPIANAGPDMAVKTGFLVSLDGSGSTDRNQDVLTYDWTVTSVPAGSKTTSLNNPTFANPSFTPDIDGDYVFSLLVNDGQLQSMSVSKVTIKANSVPVANAGEDRTVATNLLVTLDGSASSDAFGGSFTYSWTITTKPSGSTLTALAGADTAYPSFTPTPNIEGAYVFKLTVSDGVYESSDQVIIITTNGNLPPIANAGTSRLVLTNTTVMLDGSGSRDDNGDQFSYLWSVVSAPESPVNIQNPTTVNPSFIPGSNGSYVFSLVTNDGKVASGASMVTITASDLPVAHIQAPEGTRVETGTLVLLDGTKSEDPAGNALSYKWTITPPVDTSVFDDVAAKPSFIPNIDGDYVVGLVVTSSTGVSLPAATLTIVAATRQGRLRIPLEVVFPTDLPLISWADQDHSYYHITGLSPGATYDISISGLTANADLGVYADAGFLTLLCESASTRVLESCSTSLSSNSDLYIKVWGTLVPASERANFSLNVVNLIVGGTLPDEGLLGAPVELMFGTTDLPYDGTVGVIDSYYKVSNLVPGTTYSVRLTGLTQDAELYVYNTIDQLSALCASTGVTSSEVCDVEPVGNELYIRVDGVRVATGTRLSLDVQ